MPLTQLSAIAQIIWTLEEPNVGGFGSTTQGPDSVAFNWNGIDTDTFDEIFVNQYTIAASASQTLDLTSMVDLVGTHFSFAHALALWVQPVGSEVTVEPGGSNGLVWFFGGTSPTHKVHDGGLLFHSEPPAGPGVTVDSTHKTLTFVNSGATSLTLDVVIVGSTT